MSGINEGDIMFEKITPEQAGLPSKNIKEFIDILEENGDDANQSN